MLCATCIGMLIKPSFVPVPHHASFDNVQKAAQAGCKVCKSLLLWREQHGPDEASEKETEDFSTYSWPGVGDITFKGKASWLDKGRIVVHRLDPQDRQETPLWWIELLKDIKKDPHDEPWRVRPDRFPRRDIPANTGDVEVSKLALHWLDRCKNQHTFCQKVDSVREKDFLPPRLIEIPHEELSSCRLVDAKREVGEYKYVALSHCWGRNPSFMTLTASNEAQLRQCIPMEALPRSFREAIQACRRLGLYYIWIDSLCILQSGSGSSEDWQNHTTLMGEVYANCELNIAIAHASDASRGCYVDRDINFLQAAYIYERMLPVHETEENDIDAWIQASQESRVESSLSVVYDAENDGFSGPSSYHPLNKRGWVFQERLMSPRTLHFGVDRIIWECHDKAYNEYFPMGIPDYVYSFPGREVYKPSLARLILESGPSIHFDEEQFDSMHYRWTKLVEAYSKTDLTYPGKDKLAAIAAIAKRFGQFLVDSYVAGLFLSPSPSSSQNPDPRPINYYRNTSPGGPRYDYHSTSLFRLAWHTLPLTSKRYREDDTWESIYIDSGPCSFIQSPSWSWASLNCEVDFASYPYTCDLARIDDISFELTNPDDPYGQVAAATIVLTGPTSTIDASAWQDLLRNQTNSAGKGTPEQIHNETLTMIFLTIGGSEGYSATCGLILARHDSETYRRVGYVELLDRDGNCLESGTVTKTVRII